MMRLDAHWHVTATDEPMPRTSSAACSRQLLFLAAVSSMRHSRISSTVVYASVPSEGAKPTMKSTTD